MVCSAHLAEGVGRLYSLRISLIMSTEMHDVNISALSADMMIFQEDSAIWNMTVPGVENVLDKCW